jgi:hypothetical protein
MAPRVGCIYVVDVSGDCVRYFWVVGADRTQINSDLIVAFRCSCPRSNKPDLSEIASDDVDFYCHTYVGVGTKRGHWSYVGFHRVDRPFAMLFRDSNDYGDPSIRVSQRWYVWAPNEPFRKVGKLTRELARAEIGVVFPAWAVVNRIRTGTYGICYPAYERGVEPYA